MHPSKLQATRTAFAALGISQRLDALDTAYLERELESVEQTIYEKVYADFKARQIIPLDMSDDPGAKTVSYDMFDRFGLAKIITNYADDLPMADAFKTRHSAVVHSIGIGWQYTVEDLLGAAMARKLGRVGADLLQERASSAREGSEAKFDALAASGDSGAGLGGFVNNANVQLVAEVTGDWPTATAAEIMGDLDALVNAVVTQTKGRLAPDTLVLPLTRFLIVASKPVDTTNQKSVLQSWLERNPWIKDVFWWDKLELADAGSDGPRMICFKRDPRVVVAKIPQDYVTLPPQAKNLAFVVPGYMRVGGTVVRYPVAMGYMDDI